MKFEKYINILDNISVNINDNICHFIGPKGNIFYNVHNFLSVSIIDSKLHLFTNDKNLNKRDFVILPSIFNTNYINIKNCIHGVVNFFEYFLILKGVGYKVTYDVKSSMLTFLLGFSHPININVPNDINVELPSNSEIIIRSVDKCKAGQFASNVRFLKLPDIYKGNGIRYKDENIILKIPKKTK